MTKPFDPTKPVQTRAGHKARIITTDRISLTSKHFEVKNQPIVALILDPVGGVESVKTYSEDGSWYKTPGRESIHDLVNIPEKKTLYLNIYEEFAINYQSREKADRAASAAERIACVKVEYYEGQGLEGDE